MRSPIKELSAAMMLACGGQAGSDGFGTAMDLYRANELEQALPLFDDFRTANPENADAHAWHAETARRLQRFDESESSARTALRLDACNSFAHTVLANAYHPALSQWSSVSHDSTWAHANTAVRCDSADGNAHIALWGEALRRGETETEDETLRSLIETDFIPSKVLQFNRWVLQSVPPNAILVTNGDWDTFPARALQVVGNVRSDVVVANINMLNLEWYIDRLVERYGVPKPTIEPWDVTRRPADSVVAYWRDQSSAGRLGRPLTIAITVPEIAIPGGAGTIQVAGPFRRHVASAAESQPDTTSLRVSLEDLVAADFVGPNTSPEDRSAVRIAADPSFPAANVVFVAGSYARALREHGRVNEAIEVVEWANDFAIETGVMEYVSGMLNALRQ